jgi:hypothetical protein
MSHVIPYQKVTLTSYQYLDLHCYYPEWNIMNLSELAPHEHRAHQGEKHIFYSFTSHASLTMPYLAQAYSTRNHHITEVPSCMVCVTVLICDLWFVPTHHVLEHCVLQLCTASSTQFCRDTLKAIGQYPLPLSLFHPSSCYINHFACSDDTITIIWWSSKLFGDP